MLENLIAYLPDAWRASYYRTSAQAEIDLVLEGPSGQVIAIEVERTLAPVVGKGFRFGCEDVCASQRVYVIPGEERYPLDHQTEAIGLLQAVEWLREQVAAS